MSYQFTFETDLLRGPQEREIEVTVTYIVTDRVPATYWQPAEGGEVEVNTGLAKNMHWLASNVEAG